MSLTFSRIATNAVQASPQPTQRSRQPFSPRISRGMWYELAQVLQTISMANQTASGGPVRALAFGRVHG
jgi:hypothetical protein